MVRRILTYLDTRSLAGFSEDSDGKRGADKPTGEL